MGVALTAFTEVRQFHQQQQQHVLSWPKSSRREDHGRVGMMSPICIRREYANDFHD